MHIKLVLKKFTRFTDFFNVNNYSRALTLFNLLGDLGSTNAMEDGIKLRPEVMRGRMVRSCQDHQFVVGILKLGCCRLKAIAIIQVDPASFLSVT